MSSRGNALLDGSGSMVGLIIGVLSGIIVVLSIIKSFEQGNLDAIVQWLFTYINVVTVTIEFPFGITVFVVISLGGITASVKFRGT